MERSEALLAIRPVPYGASHVVCYLPLSLLQPTQNIIFVDRRFFYCGKIFQYLKATSVALILGYAFQ